MYNLILYLEKMLIKLGNLQVIVVLKWHLPKVTQNHSSPPILGKRLKTDRDSQMVIIRTIKCYKLGFLKI